MSRVGNGWAIGGVWGLALSLATLGVLPRASQGTEAQADQFDDHFENETVGSAPTNWTNALSAMDVFDVSNILVSPDGSQYMRMDRGASGPAGAQHRLTPAVGGNVVVEFLMRQETSQRRTVLAVYMGGYSGTELRAAMRFNDNAGQSIQYYNGALDLWTDTGSTWAVDTWYRVRLELRNATDAYDLYVDNAVVATGITMGNAATLSDVDRVRFVLQTDTDNITYVDDFEVYTHKKWIGFTSSDTTNGDNWAPNGAPGVGDSVRFTDQSLTAFQPVATAGASVGKVIVDDNNYGPNSVNVSFNGFTLTASGALDHDAGGTLSVGSGTFTVQGAADMNGTITVSTGTVNGDGTWDGTGGTITFTGAGTLALSSTVTNVASALTSSAGTVTYDAIGAAGAQTVDNGVTYYNLTTAGTGTKTLQGDVTANNDVTLNAAALEVSTFTLTVGGDLNVAGGTLSMAGSGGIVRIASGKSLAMTSGSILVTDVATTPRLTTTGTEGTDFFSVSFTGGTLNVSEWDTRSVNASGVVIGSGVTLTKFDGILWSGTFQSTGSPSILLDITGQTVTLKGHSFPASWGTHQPGAGEDYNVRANTSGTITMEDATGDWSGEDDDNDNGGTVTWTTSGIVWEGDVSAVWSTPGNWQGGALPTAGDKVIIPADPIGANDDPTVTSDTTIDRISLPTGRTVNINSGVMLSVDGDAVEALLQGGGSTAGSGTLRITAAASRSLNDGNFTISNLTVNAGSDSVNVTLANSTTLTVTGTVDLVNGSLDLGSATLDLHHLTIRSTCSAAGEGLVVTVAGAAINVSGNWTQEAGGLWDKGAGSTVRFDGTTAQSVDIEATAANSDFDRLTIANTGGTVTYVANSLGFLWVTGTLTVGSGGAFTVQDVFDPDGTLTFNDGGANNGTLRLEGAIVNDASELGTSFTPASGTVVYAQSASETVYTRINGTTAISYSNLTIDNTGGTADQEAAILTVNGNFLINDSSASFTLNSTGDMDLYGNFTNSGGAFVAGAGGLVRLLGGAQTISISGAGDNDFMELRVNGTGTTSLASNVTVSGTLTLAGGTLEVSTSVLTVTTAVTISGGALSMTGSGGTLKMGNGATLSMSSGSLTLTDVAAPPKITTSGTEGVNFYGVSLSGGTVDVAELDIRSVNASGVSMTSAVTVRRFDNVTWSGTFDASGSPSVMLDVRSNSFSAGGHVFPSVWGTPGSDFNVRANTGGTVSMEDATGDWAGEDDDSDNGGTVTWMTLGAKANLFDDPFEGKTGQAVPTRWYTSGTPTVSIVQNGSVAKDGDEYLSLTRSGNNEGLFCTFGPVISGKTVVEWLARKNSTTYISSFGIYHSSIAGQVRAELRFASTGQIQYWNIGWVSVQAYSADTWYRVRLEVDESSDTYDVYVDNVQRGSGIPMINNGTGQVAVFLSLVQDNDANTTLVDDVEVYTHKKWIGGTSANWATAANWAPSGVPAVSDTVRFTDQTLTTNQADLDSSRTVGGVLVDDDGFGPNNTDVDILTFTLTDSGVLTVDASGNLDVASGTVTVQGAADVDGTITITTGTVNGDGAWDGTGGTITLTGAGNVVLSNTVTAAAGTLTSTVGTVTYDAAVNQTVDTGVTYFNLTVDNTGATTATQESGAVLNVDGNFLINDSDASFTASTDGMTLAGNFTNNGDFVEGTGTVTLDGGTQAITVSGAGDTDLYALTINGTGTDSLGSNLTLTNILTVTAGTLDIGANTLTLSGSVTHAVNSGGVFTIGGAGQLQMADAGTFQVAYAVTPGKFVASNASAKVTKTGAGAGGFTFRIYGEADITGLTFDYAGVNGLELGNGTNNPTVTNFENVTFQNHSGAGYTFMTIRANGGFSMAPTGITFGAITAGNNAKLIDNDGALGGTVVFATFGASGAGKGDTYESDNDSNEDGTPDLAGGDAVIQWTTSGYVLDGAAVGFPTLAFDWGTYAQYAVYVAARDVGGASTADRVYVRDLAGAALYSYDIADADGDIQGTPVWDTKSETTDFGGCDMDNSGGANTLHVLYVATGKADPGSVAKIFLLVDTGTALQLPKSGCPWQAAYTHASVDEITSPLIYDTNNLYFGGEDSSDVAKIFGVQIADTDTIPGAPVVNVGAASRVLTAPAWKDFSGTVYLYMGSKQSPACPGSGTAHIYRVNTGTPGSVETDNSASALHNVNGMVSLISTRIHVGDDGGRMHGLENGSGLANLGTYPYRDTTNHAVADLNNCTYPITAAPYIGYGTWKVAYGDADGHYYVLDTTPAPLSGYPFRPGGSTAAFTNGGLTISGVHVVGNANGNVYYIDESAASAFKTYNFGSGVTIGQVGYNSNQQKFMIGTSSGGLYYLNKETDPTP